MRSPSLQYRKPLPANLSLLLCEWHDVLRNQQLLVNQRRARLTFRPGQCARAQRLAQEQVFTY